MTGTCARTHEIPVHDRTLLHASPTTKLATDLLFLQIDLCSDYGIDFAAIPYVGQSSSVTHSTRRHFGGKNAYGFKVAT